MITPTQRRLIDEHRVRRATWAARAYKAPPPPAPPKQEQEMQGILVKEGIDWVYREVPVVEAPPLAAMGPDLTPNVRKIILRTVAAHYNILPFDILGRRRHRTVITARGLVYYFLRKELPSFSLPAIGRLMAGRDHTTVLHGVRQTQQRAARSPEFTKTLDTLQAMITVEVSKMRERYGGQHQSGPEETRVASDATGRP